MNREKFQKSLKPNFTAVYSFLFAESQQNQQLFEYRRESDEWLKSSYVPTLRSPIPVSVTREITVASLSLFLP